MWGYPLDCHDNLGHTNFFSAFVLSRKLLILSH